VVALDQVEMELLELYHVYAFCFVTMFLLTMVAPMLPLRRFKAWQAIAINFGRRNIIKRYSIVGPWSLQGVFVHFLYVGVNLVCLCFAWQDKVSGKRLVVVSSVDKAASQAGYLAIVNLLLLFITPSISATADLLDISHRIFTRIHKTAGALSACLCIFHVTAKVAAQHSFRLASWSEADKLIVN
jgi:hypothetical protein